MKMCMERMGARFVGKGRDWRLPDLSYVSDLVFCGESEKDLRAMVGRSVEVCRRGLKVNAGRSKVMLLGGEEGWECEVCVNGYV